MCREKLDDVNVSEYREQGSSSGLKKQKNSKKYSEIFLVNLKPPLPMSNCYVYGNFPCPFPWLPVIYAASCCCLEEICVSSYFPPSVVNWFPRAPTGAIDLRGLGRLGKVLRWPKSMKNPGSQTAFLVQSIFGNAVLSFLNFFLQADDLHQTTLSYNLIARHLPVKSSVETFKGGAALKMEMRLGFRAVPAESFLKWAKETKATPTEEVTECDRGLEEGMPCCLTRENQAFCVGMKPGNDGCFLCRALDLPVHWPGYCWAG